MKLRTTTSRCAALTGMLAATAVLTAPHVMAAGAPVSAGPARSAVEAAGPRGGLGPLTELVIERIRFGDDVAAAKYGTDSPIEDPAREAQVLEQVRQQAGRAGVDPEVAVAFFRDQITASKIVQRGLFARWAAHPDEAPTTRPDLGRIREQLDRLTTALLDELEETARVRERPLACAAHLALARGAGAARHRLDGLHRHALTTATGSVCRAGGVTAPPV
ncbi:chorismate mutase [Streptomyces sp. NPDC006552]|uniref:chorismate mutase n=1 Tax=Streptomyces sp. NPDC006552 TaxID=3157179 RepID=UPI0033BF77E9